MLISIIASTIDYDLNSSVNWSVLGNLYGNELNFKPFILGSSAYVHVLSSTRLVHYATTSVNNVLFVSFTNPTCLY